MNMKAQHGVHIGKYWDIRLASENCQATCHMVRISTQEWYLVIYGLKQIFRSNLLDVLYGSSSDVTGFPHAKRDFLEITLLWFNVGYL